MICEHEWTGVTKRAARGAGVAIALGALLIARAAAAATCEVPSGTYPTIQSAVNDVNCQPIEVAAGTYNENVLINRSLSLVGAQAGIDARTRSGSDESQINGNPAITINAPNVFVDGFTLTGPSGTSSSTGILIKGSGAVIENNILDGFNGVTTTAQAIALYRGPDGVAIVHNVISNVSSPNSAKGIFIEDSASTDPSIGVSIVGNQIWNVTSTTRGAYAGRSHQKPSKIDRLRWGLSRGVDARHAA